MRPVSCRQINVFSAPCTPGENPYYSRREDVLVPLPAYTDRAFASLCALYRLEKEPGVEKAVRLIRSRIRNLQEHDWKNLATVIG